MTDSFHIVNDLILLLGFWFFCWQHYQTTLKLHCQAKQSELVQAEISALLDDVRTETDNGELSYFRPRRLISRLERIADSAGGH